VVGSLVIHWYLTAWNVGPEQKRIAKPLTTQFVKRQPRLTKPLELKKRPQPRRRQIQREVVSVRARAAGHETVSKIRTAELVRGLARPRAEVSRGASFFSAGSEPQALAQALQGRKDTEDIVDMSLEMLDIEALNTGRYDALVIQDPSDKRNLKGFCHLSALYIPSLHYLRFEGTYTFDEIVVGPVRNLARAMNRYTSIKTDVLGKLHLGDSGLYKTPWVYTFAGNMGYELSDVELDILGQYLMEGGFVFADGHPRARKEYSSGLLSHEKALSQALARRGLEVPFEELPVHHPLYHCYFDFPGPMRYHTNYGYPFYEGKLEGLEVEGRLVAILGSNGYYSPWGGGWAPDSKVTSSSGSISSSSRSPRRGPSPTA